MALSIWLNPGARVRTMVKGRDSTLLLEPHVSYLHEQLRLGVRPFALSKRLLADRRFSLPYDHAKFLIDASFRTFFYYATSCRVRRLR